jgi:hypothetical protein
VVRRHARRARLSAAAAKLLSVDRCMHVRLSRSRSDPVQRSVSSGAGLSHHT